MVGAFCIGALDLKIINATVRWTVAADGLTEANLYLRQGRRCKQVLVPLPEDPQTHLRLGVLCYDGVGFEACNETVGFFGILYLNKVKLYA